MTDEQADRLSDERIAASLLAWYDKSRRILPWRESRDPYRIWVSEIMLQQTRVEAVLPYYERFLKALPDIKALSKAKEAKLLKLWEGLGYYNRARNLQKAAVRIMEEYGGSMPETYEQLLTLPGIGEYTAGAIASIAFSQPVPAVDGNVLRILARLLATDEDIADPKTKKRFTALLAKSFPENRPGDFNQALMELGATVCIPAGHPRCESCPWEAFCLAHEGQLEESLPVKSKAKARRIEKKTVLIVQDGRHVLLRKRPSHGLLAGLYEFPMLEGWQSEEEALAYVQDLGLTPLSIHKEEAAKHIFTHKEWHMEGYRIHVADAAWDEKKSKKVRQAPFWVLPEKIDQSYPLPSAFKAFRRGI